MKTRIRAYQAGDEGPIVELSNRSLAPHAGWVTRTVEYWRWSILTRPDVHSSDILLLESGGQIVGYAALSQDGSVLELFVDPDRPKRDRRAFTCELVAALEDHARARRCDVLTFSSPASDRVIDRALRSSGYVVEPGHCFSLGILNPQLLLQQLLAARQSRLASLRSSTFIFELTPGQYPFLLNSRLGVQLNPSPRVVDLGNVEVGGHAGDCVIQMDLCALTELIFCRVPAGLLLRQSRLRIQPDTCVVDACKLLEALVIDAEWHVPKSDGF